MPAPLPPPGCVCFPATCICKYRVCEHVSLSRRARLRPRIHHRGMKREKGRERSILLPARDETKGKLTSAQWFSLLSRNCFQTFVSYRWKRRTMWKETFSFFFFPFFLGEDGEGKEKEASNRSQIRFFQTEFHSSWTHGERISIWPFHRRRKIRVPVSFFSTCSRIEKHGRNNIPLLSLDCNERTNERTV